MNFLKSLDSSDPVWISVASRKFSPRIDRALPKDAVLIALYRSTGFPFAVKDNIDVRFHYDGGLPRDSLTKRKKTHAVALLREAGPLSS